MKLRLSDPQARFSPCRIHTPPIKTIRRPTRLLTTRITELNKPHTPHLQNLPQAHLSLFLNAPVVPNSQSDPTERTKQRTVSFRNPPCPTEPRLNLELLPITAIRRLPHVRLRPPF